MYNPSLLTAPRVKDRFIQLYSAYGDSMFRYCFFRVSDRNVALDLAQEIFMRYWDNLAKGTKINNDRAFLFTIARNIIIDWYRKKKAVSLEGLMEGNEDGEEFGLVEDNAKGTLELTSESRFLLDKLKSLSKTSQHVLYLRYVEDLNIKEIADILKINQSAASVRIHRGIEELRKITGYELP